MSTEQLSEDDNVNKKNENSKSSEKENNNNHSDIKTIKNLSEHHAMEEESQNDNPKTKDNTNEETNSKESENKILTQTPIKFKTPYKEKKKIKKKLVIIATLGILIFFSIIIVLFIITNNKKFKDSSSTNYDYINNNDTFNDATNEDNDVLSPEIIIESLSYKKNEINIYQDIQEKNSLLIINKIDENSRRNLEEKNFKTLMNGKYLFNIYNIVESSETKIYNAYAILLELNKIIGKKEENIIKIDVLNSEEIDFPFIKFDFNSNGKIFNLKISNNSNSTFIAYIKEFIEKVIPELKEVKEKRRLEIIKNKEKDEIILEKEEKNVFSNLDGSNEISNSKSILKDGKIQNVITNIEASLSQTNNFEVKNDNNFTSETKGNNLATRDSFIEGFSELINSSLNLISLNENESYTNEILNIINSKNLIDYNNINSKRRLNNYENNNFKNLKLLSKYQLRNLDDLISYPFFSPFFFTYLLFNFDFFCVKI